MLLSASYAGRIRQIDRLVYELYELSKEEIALMEQSACLPQ